MYTLLRKTITTLSIFLMSGASLFAQAPQQMSYQAVIRNSANVLVTNQAISMRISILQGSSVGTAVYAETQIATTNANGLASLAIGTGDVEIGTFSTINWAAGPFFIKTETDPTGGNNYSITGTSQLLSVPFALYAATSGSASGGINYVQSYSEKATATDNSMVSIGGVDFRINNDGFVEAKNDNENFTTQVFSNKYSYGIEENPETGTHTQSIKSIYSDWSPVATYFDPMTETEIAIHFPGYYGVQDIDVLVASFPLGAPKSFKIHVMTDGWDRVLLRVEYFH